ncbi:MAG: hypothetical protein ABI821_06430 [Pseudomonadota bacterium]
MVLTSRACSYLFLALGFLSPVVARWSARRASAEFARNFEFEPEGKALFNYFLLGALGLFSLLLLSSCCALVSYSKLPVPRAAGRKWELALLCLPSLVVISRIVLLALAPAFDPQVIHTR